MSKIPKSHGKNTGSTIKIIPTIMATMPIISLLVLDFMIIIMLWQLYIFNEKYLFKQYNVEYKIIKE